MLNMAVRNTKKLIRATSQADNIRLGRFFTKKDTASLMAGMCSLPDKPMVRVLDPGAGTGILSAAILERLCQGGVCREINLFCYENNAAYLPMLRYNTERLRKRCRKLYGVKVVVNIIEDNFILAVKDSYTLTLFSTEPEKFDYIIMNPPSELMAPNSPEALSVKDLFAGTVDLTYLFVAMASNALAPGGELVMTLPTSFSTAPNLSALRCFLLSENTLCRLHVFSTGKPIKPIKKQMIMHLRHTPPSPTQMVEMSVSSDDGTPAKTKTLPSLATSVVVHGQDKCILLFHDPIEMKVMQYMQSLPHTLASSGLKMKTGLTLPSRYRDFLYDTQVDGSIPLIHPCTLQGGRIHFPADIKGQYLIPPIPSLTQPNRNMLLIRRIPPKTDEHRLVCGVYLSSQITTAKLISTHNKLNYIAPARGEMDPPFLYGLYAFLSSSLCDIYIRLISKSEQINAKEMAELPLPSPDVLRKLGNRLITIRLYDPIFCDKAIADVLHISVKA